MASPTSPLPTAQTEPTPNDQDRLKELRDSISVCKQYRRKLVQGWNLNIDFRRGKPYASQTDEDRVAVNLDWSLTKQKQALLFSQVPPIRIDHPPQTTSPEVLPWLHNFEQRINDVAISAGIETAMDEALPDCINAAGIGVVMVAREMMTEDVEVPAIDLSTLPPEIQAQITQSGLMPDGTPIPMTTVPKVLDSRYIISRVSPADFLWPIDYVGSNFDQSPWVGRSGRLPWVEAMIRFKLNEGDKQKYMGETRNLIDQLNNDVDKNRVQTAMVGFDEIFYREYKYNPTSKSYSAIHHVVFVGDQDVPLIDEPWKGQQFDENAQQYIGALKYPIQVLTLAYISDEAIPPSDSAVGRPQVNELNKSRTQMILQREHSQPVRWFDVNRVDPMIQNALMRGTWQNMIPVQGQGTNIIGEIARSATPPENFHFDGVAKADLAELWQVGQGQSGIDIETKAEVVAVQNNMQTRIGRERAKTAKFFINLAEVLGGLLSIYEDPSTFGEGFSPIISRTLAYSILTDSTVLIDSTQRIKRLIDFINFTAKSGWVNIEPVLKEIATLSGLDASVVIQPPPPKPPVEPNISLRLTGTEDMMNPLALAFLIKSGQAPPPELIDQAKALIDKAVTPPAPPPGMEGPPPEGAPPLGGPPTSPMPEPPPPQVGEANPKWGALDRINKRVIER